MQKEILKGTPEEISKKRIEEKFQEQIVPLMKKNDECALGLSLYSLYASELPPLLCYADSESLAGQNEYENREDISQVINTMKEKLKDTNAPPEIIEMIEAGLKK